MPEKNAQPGWQWQYAKSGPYTTTLSPQDEQGFQDWVKTNKISWTDRPTSEYDMRGFYKAMKSGEKWNDVPLADIPKSGGHYPDKWKTPYHSSFSGESIYSLPNGPTWKGNALVDPNGAVLFQEGQKIPQPKRVKVDHIGVIEFPHYMSDDKILEAIRSYNAPAGQKVHTTPAHSKGITTEESERARQAKTGPQTAAEAWKPISQAINTPIPDYLNNLETRLRGALGLPQENSIEKQERLAREQFDKEHPIAGGAMQGYSDYVKGMLTPKNIGIVMAAPEWKMLSAYFAGSSLVEAQNLAHKAEEEWKKGNKQNAANFATQAILSGLTGGLAGGHAVRGKSMDTSSLDQASKNTIDAKFERAPNTDIVPTWARPAPRGTPAPSPEPGGGFKPVEVPGNIVHKMPISDPQQIGRALDRVTQIESKLNTMPPPLEPIDNRTPQALEQWKQRHSEWLKKAEPYLRQYQQAALDYARVRDRGIGQVRQLPDGTKVVYLTNAGLQSLAAGIFAKKLPVDLDFLGAALSPQNQEKVINNIILRGGHHLTELNELFEHGRNKNGQIVISAVPQKGETLADAIARLREELGHGVQNALSDALGFHVDRSDYRDLNVGMPQAMKDHLFENGYHEDDGSEIGDRQRVREATAKLMSAPPMKFGVTEDEAAAYLFQYFTALQKKHGAAALDNLVHITNYARQLKKDFANAQQPTGSVAGRTAGAGTLPGIPPERAGGYQGNLAPPQSGVRQGEPVTASANLASLKKEAAARAPEGADWLTKGTQDFAAKEGRTLGLPTYLTPDARAMEIADAYQAMPHNPNDPAVKASYDAVKSDIDKQWDHATKDMGIKFEPWKQPGQPYENSAEMTADVKNNHHLYFYQGGDMPADHPLAQVDPKTGLTYNDKLRAVHDLFGHAVGGFQFGPRGEENAWAAHSQMFSPEALPALTTETKGQNSWVNYGPQMRDAQGNLLQQGQPGYLHPKERKFAEQKAGLLPQRFHYRNDAPMSFISPNTLNLTLDEARAQVNSRIQKRFEGTARDLATALGVSPSVRPVLGSWEGGAENSVLHQFPVGTDPDKVRYFNAILGKIGFQNSTGAFFPGEGNDKLYAFYTPNADTSAVAKILLDSGLPNSTIEPAEGASGHVVYLIGNGDDFRSNVDRAAQALGHQGETEEYGGTAEFPGDYSDREAAARNFSSTIDTLEQKHPEWAHVREGFESRPDIHSLHLLIQSTKALAPEPQIGVVHYSNAPDIQALDPSYYGQNPTHDVTGSVVNRPDLKRKESFPQYWNPETYVGEQSSEDFRKAARERFGVRKYAYKGSVGAQGIYDFATDPDGILQLARKELQDRNVKKYGVRLMPSEAEVNAYAIKRLKDLGYSGRRDVNGLIASWEKIPVQKMDITPAQDLDQAWDISDQISMKLQRKKWKWRDVEDGLGPEDAAEWDTKEKRDAITYAANQTPDDIEWDAAVQAGISGKLWYDRSSRAFDALVESQPKMFKKSDKTKFLNFVSALSPVQPVRQNLLMAINLWDKWTKAGRPVDVVWKDPKNFKGVANTKAKLYRLMEGRGDVHRVALESRLYNAIRALQDQPLSGPKVSAFAPNLGEDVEKSTNDTWMAIFASIDPARINDPKFYQAVTAKVRAAARRAGIDPRQAQAAIWSFIKALAELSGWGKNRWRPPEEIIKQGLLTPELINRHAADFADMLANDEEIRDRIKEIGGNLDALDKKLGKYVPARLDEGTTARTNPELLNTAKRLEAARSDEAIARHLERKSDAPNLFDTSFDVDVPFSLKRNNLEALKQEAADRARASGIELSPEWQDTIKRLELDKQFQDEEFARLGFKFDPSKVTTKPNANDPEGAVDVYYEGIPMQEWVDDYDPEFPEYAQHLFEDIARTRLLDILNRHAEGSDVDVPMSLKKLKDEAASRNPRADRRRNFELRKRIDEMTPEEMRKMLLFDENTNLPNARSFHEAEHLKPAAAVAMSDADGLKAFNDKFGYEAGNTLLRAKADALRAAGLEAYHDKGDEFLYRGDSVEDLGKKLEQAREILRNTVFDVTMDDGTQLKLKGVDFSYGTGKDLDEAEQGQHAHKSEREARGERKRGELGGITEAEGQGGQRDSVEALKTEAEERYAKVVGSWLKRAAQDEAAKNTLSEMEANGESPKEVARQFWSQTYFNLPPGVQQLFHKYVKEAWGGAEPGSVIGVDKSGNPIKADGWLDMGEKLDLPQDPSHLQGTERGMVVLMREANQRFGKGVSSNQPFKNLEVPANQRLNPKEHDELEELADKDWQGKITTAEKLRYLQLLSRDIQAKHSIQPMSPELENDWIQASTKQTELPAFKQWFGDSKVVDDKGQPLVVYRGEHGESDEDFHSRSPVLSFGNAETASHYAEWPNNRGLDQIARRPRVIPVYLKITNPIINDKEDPFMDLGPVVDALGRDEAIKYAKKHEQSIYGTNNWDENYSHQYASVEDLLAEKPDEVRNLYGNAYDFLDDPELIGALKAKGFDGAIHAGYGENHDDVEYKVFDKSQAKSAIGNAGTFDPSTSDITKGLRRKEVITKDGWMTNDGRYIPNSSPGKHKQTGIKHGLGKSYEEIWDAGHIRVNQMGNNAWGIEAGKHTAKTRDNILNTVQRLPQNTFHLMIEAEQPDGDVVWKQFKGPYATHEAEEWVEGGMKEEPLPWLQDVEVPASQKKKATVSGEDVLQYLMKLNKWSKQEALNVLGVDEYGSNFRLQDYPLAKLKAGDDFSPTRSAEYAKRPGDLPPIILGYDFDWPTRTKKLVVRDGNHRIDAAKQRGDTTIKAYVPVDEDSQGMRSDAVTKQLRAADKSKPIPQIEKLKAEALARDPRTKMPGNGESPVVP